MERIYLPILQQHIQQYRQMAFLSGPRQVGKTTLSIVCLQEEYNYQYLNWDNIAHRELILAGDEKIYNAFQPEVLSAKDTLP